MHIETLMDAMGIETLMGTLIGGMHLETLTAAY